MGELVLKQADGELVSIPEIMKQADMLIKSGLMPKEINTPEKVVSVALYGKSQGISLEEATIGGDVYVFEAKGGKLCMMVKSERKLEQMMKSIPGFHYSILIENDTQLKVEFGRLMNGFPVKVLVDIKTTDPDIAHLLGKDNWKYKKTMLWHTACRRLSLKWPDWKRVNVDIAPLEQAEESIDKLTNSNYQENTNIQEAEVIEEIMYEHKEAVAVADTLFVEEVVVSDVQEKISNPTFTCSTEGCNAKVSGKVMAFSIDKFGKTLCMKCQEIEKAGK